MAMGLWGLLGMGAGTEALRDYLREGGDPNHQANGVTLLSVATLGRDPEAARLLVQAGADVRHVDPFTGRTALHAAAWARCSESVRMLLRAGSPVRIRDEDGNTALHCAVATHADVDLSIVSMLLGAGEDAGVMNRSGISVRVWASHHDRPDLDRLLR